MAIFQFKPMALSLVGLGPERSPRVWIEWAADEGFRAVTLDASAPGARARELDRSARRGLAALLRRRELGFVGVDLWIPPKHFLSHETVDRAVSATVGAIELAGELASMMGVDKPIVSVVFPPEAAAGTVEPMAESAATHGVWIADHLWPMRAVDPAAGAAGAGAGGEAWGVGLDAASLLLAGDDPVAEMIGMGDRLRCVRVSDADSAGRVAIGEGGLDVDAIRAGAMAAPGDPPIVLDVRGIASPKRGARSGLERWGLGV